MDKYPTEEEIQIADILIEDHPKYPRKDIPFICLPRGIIIIPTLIAALSYPKRPDFTQQKEVENTSESTVESTNGP